MHRTILMILVTLVSAALMACGGDSDSGSGSAASGGSGSGSSAGSATAGGSGDSSAQSEKVAADIQKMTADAKSCVDLVKAKRYAEAISPCERAMGDAANTGSDELRLAYEEAKTAAADEAKAAGMKAATDALAGEDAAGNAEEAAKGMLKGFGGN